MVIEFGCNVIVDVDPGSYYPFCIRYRNAPSDVFTVPCPFGKDGVLPWILLYESDVIIGDGPHTTHHVDRFANGSQLEFPGMSRIMNDPVDVDVGCFEPLIKVAHGKLF